MLLRFITPQPLVIKTIQGRGPMTITNRLRVGGNAANDEVPQCQYLRILAVRQLIRQ